MKARLALMGILTIIGLGCFGFGGSGESTGIITTAGWNKTFGRDYPYLWFRTSENTSQTDCYVVDPSNAALLQKAKELAQTREEATIIFNTYRVGSACTYCSQSTVTDIQLRR